MTLIVNLSTIHSLYPISKSVQAFAELCNNYSTGCLSCCPSFFQSGSNYAWVMYQYQTQYKALIEPYKLGKITSEEFLTNLLSIFDFLDEDDFVCRMSDSVKIADCFYREDKFALLEHAWNAIIGLEEERVFRFAALAEQAKKEPVYLISNTNELNVTNKIIQLLQRHNPQIRFNSIDCSVLDDKEPIEIAPNIFLCLSYRYQLFKTDSQTRAANSNSTSSLLHYLVKEQLANEESAIHVISQYPADLAEAEKLGIPKTNIHKDSDYFPEPTLEFNISS